MSIELNSYNPQGNSAGNHYYENLERQDAKMAPERAKSYQITQSIFIFGSQIGVIFLYAMCVKFGKSADARTNQKSDVDIYYPILQDINVMLWIGFCFLMVILRFYSWTSF